MPSPNFHRRVLDVETASTVASFILSVSGPCHCILGFNMCGAASLLCFDIPLHKGCGRIQFKHFDLKLTFKLQRPKPELQYDLQK